MTNSIYFKDSVAGDLLVILSSKWGHLQYEGYRLGPQMNLIHRKRTL